MEPQMFIASIIMIAIAIITIISTIIVSLG